MPLDEFAHEGEADAKAACSAHGYVVFLLEQHEEALSHRGREPDAVVRHSHPDGVAIALDGQVDAPAGIGVLGGIRKQVAHHLAHAHGVGNDPQGLDWDFRAQLVPSRFDLGLGTLHRLPRKHAEVDALQLQLDAPRRKARHVEQDVYVADVDDKGFRVVKTFARVGSGQTCKV